MLAQFGRLLRAVANGPDPNSLPRPSEVIPTIELAQCPFDWRLPQGIYSYAGYAYEAADAGSTSQVALYNPPNSQVIVVVEHIEVMSTYASASIRSAVQSNVAAFDNDGAEYTRDVRTFRTLVSPQPSRAPASRILSDQASAAGQAVTLLYVKGYDGTYRTMWSDQEYVIMPATALVVAGGAVNNQIFVSFYWTERNYDQQEALGAPYV